jgi:hypothetical protein
MRLWGRKIRRSCWEALDRLESPEEWAVYNKYVCFIVSTSDSCLHILKVRCVYFARATCYTFLKIAMPSVTRSTCLQNMTALIPLRTDIFALRSAFKRTILEYVEARARLLHLKSSWNHGLFGIGGGGGGRNVGFKHWGWRRSVRKSLKVYKATPAFIAKSSRLSMLSMLWSVLVRLFTVSGPKGCVELWLILWVIVAIFLRCHWRFPIVFILHYYLVCWRCWVNLYYHAIHH